MHHLSSAFWKYATRPWSHLIPDTDRELFLDIKITRGSFMWYPMFAIWNSIRRNQGSMLSIIPSIYFKGNEWSLRIAVCPSSVHFLYVQEMSVLHVRMSLQVGHVGGFIRNKAVYFPVLVVFISSNETLMFKSQHSHQLQSSQVNRLDHALRG